ncbi:hypothetical protein [Chitinophaga alhagiae]|uniref:hypothetical protein n=1 Tax=Chitinophaga alhagiae TaxID=2203219 RepID=UPI000E5B7D63|nr:hypothetical protein [Chitinophaga alhagiae]
MGRANKILKNLSIYLYKHTEEAVTAKLIRRHPCAFEQARIKMLFDFLFFYSLTLLPVLISLLYVHDYLNLAITGVFAGVFICCAFLMSLGAGIAVTGTIAALNTLLVPMVSSFTNDLDVSPIYAMPWMMACMLGYFAVNLRTALTLGVLLFLYLGLVAYMKIYNLPVFLPPTYSALDKYLVTPFLMAGYLIVFLRVWGVYYRNITRLEQQQTLQKQQQFSALINQNLTKQFLLLKGLSRSGKNEFMEGNLEMMDACFSEIEKQCDSAINLLDNPGAAGQ